MKHPNYTYDQYLEDSGANLDEYLKELAFDELGEYLFSFVKNDDLVKYTHEDEEGLHLNVDALRDDIYFHNWEVIRIDRYMSAWHKANELHTSLCLDLMSYYNYDACKYTSTMHKVEKVVSTINWLDERITKEMKEI